MGDDEEFTEWIEQGNQDQEFRSKVYKLLDENEHLKEKLGVAVRLLKQGKKQFSPETTNSDVDCFIERNSHFIKKF